MKKIISKGLNILSVLIIAGFIGYKIYILPKFSAGEKTPVFTAELINGESFSLDELNGHYVLLDFWGSWCGPCRKESSQLVDLNEKYRDQKFIRAEGFHIVSIAIETKLANWKKAIHSDQLNWPYHIVQLDRFDGAIAKQFSVKEIPTKYLLDTNGEVLLVNPSFAHLNQFLEGESK